MKILIAPAHYTINKVEGSEYTRAYEYISALAKDQTLTGDILVGYAPFRKIGNLTVHSFWDQMPRELTILKKLQFVWWVYRYGQALRAKNTYDTVWHLGPFGIGETFSLLGMSLPRSTHFVIGPVYTPFSLRPTASIGRKVYKLFTLLTRPLTQLTLKRSSHTMVIEPKGAQLLKAYDAKQVSVLPLSTDPTNFLSTAKSKLPRIIHLLSVGYLVERKRMQDIVEAMNILINKKKATKYRLAIVGSGPEMESLSLLISKYNLTGYITLTGFVERTKVHTYFHSADLFVSASLNESMPGVYFEAMQSALPLVITQNDTSLDLAKNGFGGYVVKTHDPAGIASAIQKITSNTETYVKYSSINLALMDSIYSFSKNIAQLKLNLTPPKLVPAPMVKPSKKSYLKYLLLALLCTTLLIASVRGKSGNPSVSELSSTRWKENGPFELSPERGRFTLTAALVDNHSVSFTPDMARFISPDVGYRDGRYVSLFAPLLSFLVAPGYMLGKLFSSVQFGTFLNIAVFALINVYLIFKIARHFGLSQSSSFIGGFIFLFATPAYAYAANLYQHHVTVLLLLLGILLTLKKRSVISSALVVFLWALSLTLDYPNAFLFVPIGLQILTRAVEVVKTNISYQIHLKWSYLLVVLGAVIPMLFFFWFNNLSYGGPLNMLGGSSVQAVTNIGEDGNPIFTHHENPVDEADLKAEITTSDDSSGQLSYFKARGLINGLYIQFFSPDRGVAVFSPVILLGIFGIYFLYQRSKSRTVMLCAIVIANILLYGMWGDPWGGWAFGSRYLIPSYAILAIFLSAFLDRFRKNIPIILIFLIMSSYSLYVNTAGALSTSANPPQVQVLFLESLSGRRERYSFDRGIEYLNQNTSKSYLYQTWAKRYFTGYEYFELVLSALIIISIFSSVSLYRESSKQE
ncbi:glycosyltransferase family 4 protein [Candidatus Woesebacteria bacterium]|nr:glycosyltransferase family 4 protein [Candidatus Woesebacteria bacterium]